MPTERGSLSLNQCLTCWLYLTLNPHVLETNPCWSHTSGFYIQPSRHHSTLSFHILLLKFLLYEHFCLDEVSSGFWEWWGISTFMLVGVRRLPLDSTRLPLTLECEWLDLCHYSQPSHTTCFHTNESVFDPLWIISSGCVHMTWHHNEKTVDDLMSTRGFLKTCFVDSDWCSHSAQAAEGKHCWAHQVCTEGQIGGGWDGGVPV